MLTNKEGEQYIDLGKKRHVTVRGFKGTSEANPGDNIHALPLNR